MVSKIDRVEEKLDRLSAHVDDKLDVIDSRLTSLDRRLTQHETNHHGRHSTMKQTGLVTLIFGLLTGLIKLIEIFGGVSLPTP